MPAETLFERHLVLVRDIQGPHRGILTLIVISCI